MSDQMQNDTPEEEYDDSVEESEISEEQVERVIYEFECEQNMALGAIVGTIAAIVAAGVWAGISIVTEYQIGWLAIGVGFLVGYGVKVAGKGMTSSYGYLGGALSLLSIVIGNFITILGFLAKDLRVFSKRF